MLTSCTTTLPTIRSSGDSLSFFRKFLVLLFLLLWFIYYRFKVYIYTHTVAPMSEGKMITFESESLFCATDSEVLQKEGINKALLSLSLLICFSLLCLFHWKELKHSFIITSTTITTTNWPQCLHSLISSYLSIHPHRPNNISLTPQHARQWWWPLLNSNRIHFPLSLLSLPLLS